MTTDNRRSGGRATLPELGYRSHRGQTEATLEMHRTKGESLRVRCLMYRTVKPADVVVSNGRRGLCKPVRGMVGLGVMQGQR